MYPSARESPCVLLPAGPITTDEVQRVHDDAIARIRRAVERHGLDPLALGHPPRVGDDPRGEFEDAVQLEQPLLDFGDARKSDFFPGLKAASVQSLASMGY
ncbi:hypothetical protein Poly30_48200 [Planctomycetes bacterium Poly30]|uniref:Uncharacterized protein n=1 Tax=Saltatorellus ferox TaxID=2528018 RepID=A0A518EYV0_9BACT|nr:hypothetical protein Poly30_48200 [Planctomycetes bacterium Poly30]